MKLNKLNINKVLVVGLGHRTGLSVSNFLTAKGVTVVVSDMKSENELADVIKQLAPGIKVIAGEQLPGILDEGFDTIILSPGVPRTIPLIAEAYRRSVPVISEIELSYRFINGRIIAITGTDGKSTTTSLVGHVLKELGFDAFVGGNIGIPLISIAEKTGDKSITVIELSSFQLEAVDEFRPHVASLLNVLPDHLDRYSGIDEYFNEKIRITMNQGEDDIFIYNKDDEVITGGLDRVKAGKLSFSLLDRGSDAFYEDGYIYLMDGGTETGVLDTNRMRIMGIHNVQNAMAALLMILSLLKKDGITPDYDKIAEAFYSFTGLEHRMERIGEYEGRIFINDSKATTVNAVEMAVRSISGEGVLILGGRTKGDDYARLIGTLVKKIKSIILIGESRENFSKVFKKFKLIPVESLDDAVIQAMRMSKKGDTILLSPACASFDMFESYEQRGAMFKKSFNKLVKGDICWT